MRERSCQEEILTFLQFKGKKGLHSVQWLPIAFRLQCKHFFPQKAICGLPSHPGPGLSSLPVPYTVTTLAFVFLTSSHLWVGLAPLSAWEASISFLPTQPSSDFTFSPLTQAPSLPDNPVSSYHYPKLSFQFIHLSSCLFVDCLVDIVPYIQTNYKAYGMSQINISE